jgi:formiminoglutamase
MLDNWLRPINLDDIADLSHGGVPLDSAHFGERIARHDTVAGLPPLQEVRAAIVGIGEEEADAVRRALYRMSWPFGKMAVADLGNARKTDNAFVLPMLQELMDSRIVPVIIGRTARLAQAQFKAHFASQPSVSLVAVDERVPFHPRLGELDGNYLNPVMNGKSRPFHFGIVGCQSHFVDDETFQELEKINADTVRLGKARASLPDLEPVLRDADMACFHLAALKAAEAPGMANPTPSGFTCEEACQLARYAGMNDKLTSFGIYGFEQELDEQARTAQVVAQMAWYFLDGLANRRQDFPASMDGLTEYIVDFKGHDHTFTFWKSNKTGRWWIQVPVKTKKKHQRHRLIPCSHGDYLLTSKGELPDRLLLAFKRFE